MKSTRGLLAAMAILGLCACTVPTPPLTELRPVRSAVDWPEIGSRMQALAGETILRQGHESRWKGVRLDRPNNIEGLVLSAGFYPQIGEDADYTYHSYRTAPSANGFGHILPKRDALGAWIEAPKTIRFARRKQETCILFREMLGMPCDRQVPYERLTKTYLAASDLQRSLVYIGLGGGKLHLRYTEQSGHYARDEKAEDLLLAPGPAGVIQHGGARIVVHRATPDSIDFTVERTFADYWSGRAP